MANTFMVLRIIILSIYLFHTGAILASDKKNLKRSYDLYITKRYKASLNLFRKIKPAGLEKNNKVTYYKIGTMIYLKGNYPQKALSFNKKLIMHNSYLKLHNEVQQKIKKGLPIDEPKYKKLLKVYYFRVEILISLYKKNEKRYSAKAKRLITEQVERYAEFFFEYEENEDEVQAMLDDFRNFKQIKKNEKYFYNFDFGIKFDLLSQKVVVTEKATSNKYDFLSQGRKYCLGGGFSKENYYHRFGGFYCFGGGVSDYSTEQGAAVSIEQKNVLLTDYQANHYFDYKLKDSKNSVGAEFVIGTLTSADLKLGDDYEYEKLDAFYYGVFISYKFFISNFSFALKFGQNSNETGFNLSNQFSYHW